MTDRELLELAAKAAGLDFFWRKPFPEAPQMDLPEEPCLKEEHGGWDDWNPLTDDGDAFRLAVKCHLMIDTADFGMCTTYWRDGHLQDECHRRAIVRAAAEIGKAMK